MPKIRTTVRPDQEIDVTDAEYLDLKRQGLVHETPELEPVGDGADIDRSKIKGDKP